ncbi:NADPH:quinone oxidoreductase family protein [Nocardioides massiliensis]|uniref:NADPH2:quinone reductase n=1 Tax=Nocardioides massiliensis TaxID=1325935 RepID=A0ABT9NL61_9ACTN|nr:NADPH:quinone oxidoreductase family protein [Nocardioides massiliensis]MDP9820770.1 NADPH2:quinone reductase [Nocardioides massiliensis]
MGAGLMRAAVVRRRGGPEVITIEEIPAPKLKSGAVRVAVAAAALNFPDLLIMAGTYQATVELPYVPGCEFSGRVLDVADDVTTIAVGDVVFGLATHGALADQIVIDACRVTAVPNDGVEPRSLAAYSVTYTTSYHALRTFADLKPGEWLAVLGSAGGVGLAAVDIARALGARPIAIARGQDRLAQCMDAGAEATIDYSSEDVKVRLKEITGAGVDVVIDPVGGPSAEQALRAMRWGGRYVVVGFASGDIPRIPLNLVLLKGVHLMGFENRTVLQHLPDTAPAHRREILERYLAGEVRPRIGSVHTLDDVAAGLESIAARRIVGKVVVDVDLSVLSP